MNTEKQDIEPRRSARIASSLKPSFGTGEFSTTDASVGVKRSISLNGKKQAAILKNKFITRSTFLEDQVNFCLHVLVSSFHVVE